MSLFTNDISLIFIYIILAILVIITNNSDWNQLVTNGSNYFTYLVGTSETTRVISFETKNLNKINKQTRNISEDTKFTKFTNKNRAEICFNQWLAGLIDGNGCFLLSKAGYTSCEITLPLADERILRIIQNKLGGSIKLRSGVKAVRWRLNNIIGMINLIDKINGYIRHTGRFKQLSIVCAALNIQILTPDTLNNTHGWFSGFFDAEGTINFDFKGTDLHPQLTLSVTNKLLADVLHFKNCFGGEIYFDKSKNGYYKWSFKSQENINLFCEYNKICPIRSIKRNRLFLIKKYYELVNLGAYNTEENSILNKA